jgi:lysophospholipase L1-like esterase
MMTNIVIRVPGKQGPEGDVTPEAEAARDEAIAARDVAVTASYTAGVARDEAEGFLASITVSVVIAGIFQTSAAGVATGLSYVSRTNGSGGTNGTFTISIPSQNGGTAATLSITVASGAISAASITVPGTYFNALVSITNAQIVTAGATGITGASVTLVNNGGVLNGRGYAVVASGGSDAAYDIYTNVAGVATETGKSVPALGAVQTINTYPASSSGTSWVSGYAIFSDVTATVASTITSFSVGAAGISGYLLVASKDGSNRFDGDLRIGPRFNSGTGGVVVLNTAMDIPAGYYAGIFYEQGTAIYSAASPGVWYGVGLPSSTPWTRNTGVQVSQSFVLSSQFGATVKSTYVNLQALIARVAELENASLKNSNSLSIGQVPRHVYLGDSIMQQNTYADATAVSFNQAIGSLSWAKALFPSFDIDTWYYASDPLGRYTQGANLALAGDTAQNIAVTTPTRLSSLLTQASDRAHIAIGTNDVFVNGTSAVTLEGYLTTIYDTSRKVFARTYIYTIRPRSHSAAGWTSGKEAVRVAVNTWIRAYVAANANCVLVDADAIYDDGSSTGTPKAGYHGVDGVHPAPLGAQAEGVEIARVLKLYERNVRAYPGELNNWMPNATLTDAKGTGVAGSNVTGTVVDAMTSLFYSSGGSTAVASVVTNSDGSKGQRLVITASGANSADRVTFQLRVAMTLPPSLSGKWCKAYARVTLATWNGWRAASLRVQSSYGGLNGSSTDTILGNQTLLIETPPFPLSLATFNIFMDFYIAPLVATGTGTVTIEKMWFGEVQDPRPLRNF